MKILFSLTGVVRFALPILSPWKKNINASNGTHMSH